MGIWVEPAVTAVQRIFKFQIFCGKWLAIVLMKRSTSITNCTVRYPCDECGEEFKVE